MNAFAVTAGKFRGEGRLPCPWWAGQNDHLCAHAPQPIPISTAEAPDFPGVGPVFSPNDAATSCEASPPSCSRFGRNARGSCVLVRVVQCTAGRRVSWLSRRRLWRRRSPLWHLRWRSSNPGSASPESRVWSGHGSTHRTTQVRKITRITQGHRRQAGKTRTGSVGKRRRPCRR